MKAIAAVSLSVLLAACATTTPPPPAPPPTAAGAFLESAGRSTAPLPSVWWRLFEDPALDAHVQRALAANADIRAALANLEASRALARAADGARVPVVGVESGIGPDRADRQPSTSNLPKTSYELGVTIAYEIDLFGRLRAASAAARADAGGSAALLDAARLTVVADTVSAYVEFCAAQAGDALARTQIETQQRSRDLVADQLAAGEVSPLELAQATVLRDQALAAAPAFEAQRRRALYQLAALQARTPAEAGDLASSCPAPPMARAAFPVGDGAALLARRPDVRQAEQRLNAAAARVDVANADLYPRIQLGASGGLIGGGSDAFLTPLITWSFLNPAARARVAAAKGTQAAALAQWDAAVLRALQEVEAALADERAAIQAQKAAAAAVDQAQRVVTGATARHRWGADSYLVVIDAERSRNIAQIQALSARQRIAQTQVVLFRALGGGWENPPGAISSTP